MDAPRKSVVVTLLVAGVAILSVFLVSRVHSHRSFKFPARSAKRSLTHPATPPVTIESIERPTNLVVTPPQLTTVGDLHHRLLKMMHGTSIRQHQDAPFQLGQQLGAEDFTNALAIARHIPVEWTRDVFVAGIFVARGREQGQRVLDEFVDAKDSDNPYDLGGVDNAFAAGGAMVGWANADPRAAIAYAKQHDSSDKMLARLAYAGGGLERLDAMLADANALPSGVTSVAGQDNFLNWAKADPDRAVDYAMTLDESLQMTVLERIAHGWATEWSANYRADFLSYLNIAVTSNPDELISRSAVQWWAQHDPQGAVDYAATIEDDSKRNERLNDTLPIWVESDADRAVEWLKSYAAKHNDAKTLAERIVNNLDEVDPETAARVLTAFPVLADDASLRSNVVAKWMEWDPLAALQWATKTEPDRNALVADTRIAALDLGRWNLDEALDWAQGLTDASLRPAALTGVALAQGYADGNPSTDWMLALPAGAERDRAVFVYVTGFLAHADGTSSPDESILTKPVATISDLANEVQKSNVDAGEKQRLLALIYGWRS